MSRKPRYLADLKPYLSHDPMLIKQMVNSEKFFMHRSSGLSAGHRELICAFLTGQDDCRYLTEYYAEQASPHFDYEMLVEVVAGVNLEGLDIKLRSLLAIASCLQSADYEQLHPCVEAALVVGASHAEVHDAIVVSSYCLMTIRLLEGMISIDQPKPIKKSLFATISDWWNKVWSP